MLGNIKGRRRRGQHRMGCLDGITDLMYMSLSKLQEIVKVRGAQLAAVRGVAKSITWPRNWTPPQSPEWLQNAPGRLSLHCDACVFPQKQLTGVPSALSGCRAFPVTVLVSLWAVFAFVSLAPGSPTRPWAPPCRHQVSSVCSTKHGAWHRAGAQQK